MLQISRSKPCGDGFNWLNWVLLIDNRSALLPLDVVSVNLRIPYKMPLTKLATSEISM